MHSRTTLVLGIGSSDRYVYPTGAGRRSRRSTGARFHSDPPPKSNPTQCAPKLTTYQRLCRGLLLLAAIVAFPSVAEAAPKKVQPERTIRSTFMTAMIQTARLEMCDESARAIVIRSAMSDVIKRSERTPGEAPLIAAHIELQITAIRQIEERFLPESPEERRETAECKKLRTPRERASESDLVEDLDASSSYVTP